MRNCYPTLIDKKVGVRFKSFSGKHFSMKVPKRNDILTQDYTNLISFKLNLGTRRLEALRRTCERREWEGLKVKKF